MNLLFTAGLVFGILLAGVIALWWPVLQVIL